MRILLRRLLSLLKTKVGLLLSLAFKFFTLKFLSFSFHIRNISLKKRLLSFSIQLIFPFLFFSCYLSLLNLSFFLTLRTSIILNSILLLESMLSQRWYIKKMRRFFHTLIQYLLGKKPTNDSKMFLIMSLITMIVKFCTSRAPTRHEWTTQRYCFLFDSLLIFK